MSHVISSASMSLDGYIAYDDNSVGPLFDWYNIGENVVKTASDDVSFNLTQASADYWRAWTDRLGALVVGRTLFDYTDGWRGRHPLGVPIIVLTHEPPTDWRYPSEDFYFVTEGITEAVDLAKRLAGDDDVAAAGGSIATQALDAGLLDFVAIDLVPVVLGTGRPYFTTGAATSRLNNPITMIQTERVTHLVFPVAE